MRSGARWIGSTSTCDSRRTDWHVACNFGAMNATPSISQAQPSRDPMQAAAPTAADQTDRGNGQDFAGALSDAGSKPVRRHTAAKQHDPAPSGSPLPASGNPPPPTTGAPAAPTASYAGAVTAQGAAAIIPPAAPSGQTVSPPVASAAATESAARTPPAGPVDVRNIRPGPGGTVLGAGMTIAFASSIRSLPATAPTAAATPVDTKAAPQLPPTAASNITDTKPNDGATGKATAIDPTLINAQSAADTDAAAQATMAAALAQGTSAPSPDSSASADALATPDTGVTLQAVAAANDESAPAPSAVHALTASPSAAGTAATAASIVQAVSAAADAGATDKHSRDNSPDGSVGAAQLLTSNAPTDAAPVPAPTFKVSAGVDTAEFGQGVADRVSMMMDSNLTSAKLQVNPPSLGPIEVRIALQGGHAQVWLSTHSAVTRDALASTAPKLREMLGAQGFGQVSVDISQRSFHDRSPQQQAYEALPISGGDSASSMVQAATAISRSASGLLDAYA